MNPKNVFNCEVSAHRLGGQAYMDLPHGLAASRPRTGVLYVASCLGYLPIDEGIDCECGAKLGANFCTA
jgi:hypothetical protein